MTNSFILGCHVCNQQDFNEKRALRNHLRRIHNIEVPPGRKGVARKNYVERLFACPSCPEIFVSLDDQRVHIECHIDRQNQVDHSSTSNHPTSSQTISTPSESSTSIKDHDDSEDNAELVTISPENVDMDIREPKTDDRFVIHGFDVSKAFHDFQVSVQKRIIQGESLKMESHVQHVLSLSSIFLIKPKRFHDDFKKHIPDDLLEKIVKCMAEKFDIDTHTVSLDLVNKLFPLIDDVLNKKIDRDEATVKLMQLKTQVSSKEYRILKSFAMIMQKSPEYCVTDTILEQELITRYLEPAFAPLFDDILRDTLFRWTAAINQESKLATAISISRSRPDACVSGLNGVTWGISRGFGEVKSSAEANNNYLVARDLIRLGIFAKNSIDLNNMKGCLVFQSIGRHTFFYLVTLLNDAIYVMYEIAKIEIPMCISDLPMYLGQIGRLMHVLTVYDDYCVPTDQKDLDNLHARKRKSMTDAQHDRILDPSKNRKRQSITTFHFQ